MARARLGDQMDAVRPSVASYDQSDDHTAATASAIPAAWRRPARAAAARNAGSSTLRPIAAFASASGLNTAERTPGPREASCRSTRPDRRIDAVIGAGGKVVGAASIIDRSGGTADVGLPRIALATLKVETYDPSSCPLCREGSQAVKPGSRKS